MEPRIYGPNPEDGRKWDEFRLLMGATGRLDEPEEKEVTEPKEGTTLSFKSTGPQRYHMSALDAEFIALPLSRLKEYIAKYVAYIETGVTLEVCKCEWEDSFPIPGGNSVKMRKSVDFHCPVHTKEGLLLQFFTWVEEHGN